MELLYDFIASFGFGLEFLSRIALFGPIVILVFAVISFLVMSRRSRQADFRDRIVRTVISSARRKTTVLTPEEIAARLAPRTSEEGGRKVLVDLAEVALRIFKFNRKETEEKLIQAGDRDPRAISRYILQRGAGMLIAPLIAWNISPYIGFPPVFQFAFALVAVMAGGILVDARLDKAVARRRSRMFMELPVLLDLLTIYLEAGQSFDIALARASIALRKSFPTAADEIAYLRRDLDLSVDRERSLRTFAERIKTTTAATFISIVVQSERRGNPVAPSLRSLSREARKEVIFEIERKAQKLPTLMQLPMFLFILPAIFMSVIGPAVVQVMIQFGGP